MHAVIALLVLLSLVLLAFRTLGGGSHSASSTASLAASSSGRWISEKDAVSRFRESAWGQALLTSDEDIKCSGNGAGRSGLYADFWCMDAITGSPMWRVRPMANGDMSMMNTEAGVWSTEPRQANTPAKPTSKKKAGSAHALPPGVHWLGHSRIAVTTCGALADMELSPDNGRTFQAWERATKVSGTTFSHWFSWCSDTSVMHDGVYGRPDDTVIKLTPP
jgi:hypothetical protein